MKNFIQEGIDAFPTSKKHLIGFGLGIVCTLLLITFNLFGWNELWFYDTWLFGYLDVVIHPFVAQSFITLFIGWSVNFIFEYFQQRNIPINNRPTWKDTKWDCNYMALSSWFGMFLITILL